MGALYEPIDPEPPQSYPQDVEKLRIAETKKQTRNDVEAWKKKKQGQAAEQEKPERQLPVRAVPDSFVDGRPTTNTAMRRVLPSDEERLQAEAQTRELMK